MKNLKTFEEYSYIYENENGVDEGFKEVWDKTKEIGNNVRKTVAPTHEEKREEALSNILKHRLRSKAYKKALSEDKDKAEKFIEFFIKNPEGHPVWTMEKNPIGEWVDKAEYIRAYDGEKK